MLTIKAGEIAGRIWNALDEKGTLTGKELKKVCGRLTAKSFTSVWGGCSVKKRLKPLRLKKTLRRV